MSIIAATTVARRAFERRTCRLGKWATAELFMIDDPFALSHRVSGMSRWKRGSDALAAMWWHSSNHETAQPNDSGTRCG
jgi:hypothetical protein